MRKVVYKIAGMTVDYETMKKYEHTLGAETIYEKIPEAPTRLSPKREAMLKQFGYVSPKLKDMVAV